MSAVTRGGSRGTDAWAVGSPGERPRFDPSVLAELAARHGTPLYVYDLDHVESRLARLAGFDAVRYAQKANTNLALLRRLARAGARVDAVSAGEVMRALAAGFAPRDVQVTSDALDRDLESAVREHGLDVSAGSLDAVAAAASLGLRRVTLRLNPGFGAGHHAKVTTGGAAAKHGIWHEELASAIELARRAGLAVTGLHVHLGSGVTHERREELIPAIGSAAGLIGAELERVSIGGGLPIPYRPEEKPFDPAPFTAAWLRARDAWQRERGGRPLELEVEPGRYLVAHSGVLVTEVLGTNRTPEFTFVLVDAGFHTLARPAMYGAYHHVTALAGSDGPLAPRVVAGPLCESSDVLTQTRGGAPEERMLPAVAKGDYLLIHDAGAYGASMSSGYNVRPLPAEVVIEGGVPHLARAREDLDARLAEERRRLRGGPG